ncbi:MAG: recombinase family protein, partial [Chloroflexota bacterium]|nr:recombinase family protein [Chloroflexota bacterium]
MATRTRICPSASPTRVAIYCRVSSAGQEDNSSLGTQEARCRDYAAERGWTVVNVYREVHTGAELFERPQLGRLRDALRAGNVDVVLAYALDRVSRNQAHLGFLLSEWDHLGKRLELVTEDIADTPEGRLLQSVRGFVAEMERLKIAERSRRGVRARVDSGRPIPGQRAPFGFRWRDDEKTGYEFDPEKAPILRRIFEDVLRGKTLRSIVTSLTADGIPTPSGRGRRWEVSTLHHILTNPVYAGRAVAYRSQVERRQGRTRTIVLPESEWVTLPPGTAPAIITEAELAAVQTRLAWNRATAPRNNAAPEATLLRCGVARCGYCGYPLAITKRSGRAHMYRCHPVGRERHGCPSFGVMAPILDAAVWQHVEEVLTKPAIIAAEVARRAKVDPYKDDLLALERRLTTVANQRARLAKAVAALDDEAAAAPLLVELQNLAGEAKVLATEQTALELQASEHEANNHRLADLAMWCGHVAGNLPTLTYQERRMVLDALGVSVKVYRVDHDPRWEITMAPSPIEDVKDTPIAFSNRRDFSFATSPMGDGLRLWMSMKWGWGVMPTESGVAYQHPMHGL